MRHAILGIILGLSLFGADAMAACSGPGGVEGQIIYNRKWRVMQFCDDTHWVGMGSSNTGIAATGAAGEIQFSTGSGALAADSNLFWDNTNKLLGIGTNTPSASLHITSNSANSTHLKLSNTVTSGGDWAIYSSGGGPAVAGTFGIYQETSGATRIAISPAGNVGIGTTAPNAKLHVINSTATGGTFGVAGQVHSPDGRGIEGHAIATTGGATGVYGLSYSTSGYGVHGRATATTGLNYGVRGQSDSTGGRGVVGYASSTTGGTIGVHGRTDSPAGFGVHGESIATTGVNHGVYGRSNSTGGYGVFGFAAATSGSTTGVYGQSDSTEGRGVIGHVTAATGSNFGVHGRSDSPDGFGIHCHAPANASGCGGNRAWTNTSDARLKRDITALNDSYGLDVIMKLRPVSYTWRTNDTGKVELGFIAQEVEPILPSLVGNSPDTEITANNGTKQTVTAVKSLSYAGFVVPLVKAVQELKAENDTLRSQVSSFEMRLRDLEREAK